MKRILLFCAAVFQILGSSLPMVFNWGQSIAQRSEQANAIITPPGFAFSIWGPIFLLGLVLGVYGLLRRQKNNLLIDKVAWPTILLFTLCGSWGLWVPFYGTDLISFVVIAGMAFIGVFIMFAIGNPSQYAASDKWCVLFPVTLLAGWIMAATSISVVAVAKFYSITFVNPDSLIVTLPVLCSLVGIVSFTVFKTHNFLYVLAPVWALSTLSYDKYTQNSSLDIALAAAIGAVVLVCVAFFSRRSLDIKSSQ